MSGILVPIAARLSKFKLTHHATENGRVAGTNRVCDLGADKEGNKKPSVPKSAGGVSELPRISTCSLAVFYVEQVALNRHVSPQQAAPLLMTPKAPIVNTVSKGPLQLTTISGVAASNKEW
jgi:hypothetical protein